MNKKGFIILLSILLICISSLLIISFAFDENYSISSDLKEAIGVADEIEEELIKAIIENGVYFESKPTCNLCYNVILEGNTPEELEEALKKHKLECEYYEEGTEINVDYDLFLMHVSDDEELTLEEVKKMTTLEIDGSEYSIENIFILTDKILPLATNLTNLTLKNCKLENLDFVSKLTNLNSLYMNDNDIESIDGAFDNLDNLYFVDVSNNYLDIYNEFFEKDSKTLKYIDSLNCEITYKPQKVKASDPDNEIITELTDENLLKLINFNLKGEKTTDPVGKKEILRLTSLDSSSVEEIGKIKSINGLKYAKNLEMINLEDNEIDDLSALLDAGELKLEKLYLLNIDKNYLQREEAENPNDEFFAQVEKINSDDSERHIEVIDTIKYLGPVNKLDEYVTINDKNLEEALRQKLNLSDESPITRANLLSIEEIDLSNKDIEDISPLMFLNNAKNINLAKNTKIKDISALQYCYSVEKLDLSNTGIVYKNSLSEEEENIDIYILINLPYLKELNLSNNLDIQKTSLLSSLKLIKGDYQGSVEKPETLLDLSNTGITEINMLSEENLSYDSVNKKLIVNVKDTPAINEFFNVDMQTIINDFPATIMYSSEDTLIFVRLQEASEEIRYKVEVYGENTNLVSIKYVKLINEDVDLETEQNRLEAFKDLEEDSINVDLMNGEFTLTNNGKYLVYVMVGDKEFVKLIQVTDINTSEKLYELVDESEIILDEEKSMVTGIQPQSSVSDITEQFKNLSIGVTIKIYKTYEEDSTNNEELTTGNVGTGMKLIVEKDGKKLEEYVIVIYGDTTGDGRINIFDITTIVDHILEKETLENEYLESANANRDTEDKVNIFDITTIVDHILEKESIEQN